MFTGAKRCFRSSCFWIWGLLLMLTGAAFAQTPTLDSEEQTVLQLINNYRVQNGLSALRVSVNLTRAADWMSADMAAKNYFGHTDSTGRDPFTRMSSFGYTYPTIKGENLAAGYNDAVRTFNQWKASPSHNEVMLNKDLRAIGISRVYAMSSTYKYYWTTDFGGIVDATLDGSVSGTQPVRTVNAGSYFQSIAPDSIATTFGEQMAAGAVSAPSLPLPISLGNVSLTINDQTVPLLYVSPTQINFIVPSNVAPGTASVRVFNNGVLAGSGTVLIESVSPAIFTAAANGQGAAIAQTTPNGASFQPTVNTDGSARAISVGTAAAPNYLVMYGTGLRQRSSLNAVQVTIGGVTVPILYLGAHSRLVGVEQLNLRLPLEIKGRGMVDIVVTVDGRVSNIAKLNIGN